MVFLHDFELDFEHPTICRSWSSEMSLVTHGLRLHWDIPPHIKLFQAQLQQGMLKSCLTSLRG